MAFSPDGTLLATGTPTGLVQFWNADTGALLGYVNSAGNHGMAVTKSGDLLLGPGPDQTPQRFTRR